VSTSNGFAVRGYSFSPELFSQGFAAGSGPCRCSSDCCSGGVYADVAERDRILALKEKIKAQMDETQTTDENLWFDSEIEDDRDFASGQCVGTTVVNNKCAFLNVKGHCSIQLAAVAEGLDRWAWKPLFCVLYPIEITDRVIGFDPMLQDEKPCCTINQQFEIPLFRACKDELIHLLGADGYARLEEHYAGLEKEKRTINI
jgi:hypothetical protein